MSDKSGNINTIREIETAKLRRHPKNVRRSYDGIDELADSIKERGIMQNMTVVEDPADKGYYLVVIGNRRLEAARKAGLKTCPCSVVKMSESEQIATMLLENMQRNDLNIAEETRGVQMCLDLGMTEEELAQKTGLSKKTIRSRKRIADMNLDLAGKDVSQITIGDLEQLTKIKTPERRQKAFDALGTVNFDYYVANAVKEEKQEKWYEEMRKTLSFATELKESYSGRREAMWYIHEGEDIPEQEEGFEYYYYLNWGMCYLYKVDPDREEDDGDDDEAYAPREESASEKARKARNEIGARMFAARKAFMSRPRMGVRRTATLSRLLEWMTMCAVGQYDLDDELFMDVIGDEPDEYEDGVITPEDAMERVCESLVAAEALVYAMLETGERIPCWDWNGRYNPNDKYMTNLYLFLTDIGYTMSEEEQQILGGTHEAYVKEDEE